MIKLERKKIKEAREIRDRVKSVLENKEFMEEHVNSIGKDDIR